VLHLTAAALPVILVPPAPAAAAGNLRRYTTEIQARDLTLSSKTYGRDGPPQLRRYAEDAPADILNEWIAGDPDFVWSFPDAAWWRKRMRCRCGTADAFRVRSADVSHPQWISGKFGGCQRCDLICTKCGGDLQFFDDGVHGYNAVVCDDRSGLPPYYLDSNRSVLKTLLCDCGGTTFSVIAEAMYDCGDGIEEVPIEQWDDAYGAFRGFARCSSCGKIQEISNAETA